MFDFVDFTVIATHAIAIGARRAGVRLDDNAAY
jgi:hypothetical protein